MTHTNLEIWDASNFGVPYIVAENDATIAHFYGENAYENAKAFVASKDMYEALEAIVEKVEDGCSIESDEILEVKIEDAKQALKKAKGESQ